jgi:selenocysteine-specific elongation factor
MIIGTAGHIDHGKTSLVKCLTGIDADRLPEEKARGITIDLGFAYVPNGHGQTIGFVDVPGHEKFVHTMAAGATGIDHGLLVIAADDGIMPQTKEHLRILDLLGVPEITVALTKIDLVDESRVSAVSGDIQNYLANTRFANTSIYSVSTRSGDGVESLKKNLFAKVDQQQADKPAYFRLAIDRVFVVKGVGVAITGAVIAGQVKVGDTLLLTPQLTKVKVRSIHAQNTPAEEAGVGTRCGIVISGVEYSDVTRGQWLVAPELHQLTQRFDCVLTVPADAERAIKDGEVLLLHHGTEHLSTRIILLNASEAAPGAKVYAQCAFDKPMSVCWHDRIVFRDSSARHTLAGGLVLDIDPPIRGRKKPERIEILDRLVSDGSQDVFSQILANSVEPICISTWAFSANRLIEPLIDLAKQAKALQLEVDGLTYVVGMKAQDHIQGRIKNCLEKFHAEDPDEPGVAMERLRRMACPLISTALFKAWVTEEIKSKSLAITGSFVHLPDHKVELTPKEQIIWEKIYPRLIDGQYDPPWVRDLASALGEPEANIRMLLRKVSRTSGLVQLVPDLFYPISTMRIMADIIRDIVETDGHVTVISFKDRVGLGRKRAIQILEAFDRLGFTRRLVSFTRGKKELEKDHRIVRNTDLFASEGIAA